MAFVKLRQSVHLPQFFNEIVIGFIALLKDVTELPSFSEFFDLIGVSVYLSCFVSYYLCHTLISSGSWRWLLTCFAVCHCFIRLICVLCRFILLRIFLFGCFRFFFLILLRLYLIVIAFKECKYVVLEHLPLILLSLFNLIKQSFSLIWRE